MPHVKHPVSNSAHGCAQPLHIIGFGLCSKPELKTEQEVRFLNKLLVLKTEHEVPFSNGHGCMRKVRNADFAPFSNKLDVEASIVFCNTYIPLGVRVMA